MTEFPITEHLPYLQRFLKGRFGSLSDADREDILQEVCIDVLKVQANDPNFAPNFTWASWLAALAINAVKRHWSRKEREWFKTLADEPAIPSQSAIAGEIERRGLQTLLLSDILREYVARCEDKMMQTEKEVYERRARGQETIHIAEKMGLRGNSYYKHVQRARDWVRERMLLADVDRYVFQTFLRQRRETPITRVLPDHVPHNFSDVLHLIIHEAGALCPSDGRLTLYLASPNEADLRDVRYHVEEAGCPLCAARREVMLPPTTDLQDSTIKSPRQKTS